MDHLDHFNLVNHPQWNEDKSFVKHFDKAALGQELSDYGITDAHLQNEDYHFEVSLDELTHFNTMKFDVVSVYVYYSKEYGGFKVGPNSRPFCKRLIGAGKAYTRADIFEMNTWSGKANRAGNRPYNVFEWRGGNNCKHQWVRFAYDTTSKKLLTRTKIQPAQPSTKP